MRLRSHSLLTCGAAALLPLLGSSPLRADCGLFVGRFETGTTCAWSSASGITEDCDPAPMTAQEVQTGATPGTNVVLSNVVVTALTADAKHLWVADAHAASACQGVHVNRGAAATVLGGEFVPGAVVDVGGTTAEFDFSPPGDTLTQLTDGTATFVASGGAPTPLPGVSLASLSAIDLGEPYEGVLVETGAVQVTSTASGDRVTVSDQAGSLVLDDVAFDYAASSYPSGTCFSSVVGVMTVNVIDDERRLLPRSAADLPVVSCP